MILLFPILFIFLVLILTCFMDFSPVPIPIIPITLLILFLFIIAFIHKVRKQCKKYGAKNVFRVSYTGKDISLLDYVYRVLKELPDSHTVKKWGDIVLFLNTSGIYVFTCFDYKGLVAGNYQDEFLTCISGKQESRVHNPLPELTQKTKRLQEQLNIPVKPYLVIENHCQFFVKENTVETIFLKNVYYHMVSHKEKRLSKEELNIYANQLSSICQKVSTNLESLETT